MTHKEIAETLAGEHAQGALAREAFARSILNALTAATQQARREALEEAAGVATETARSGKCGLNEMGWRIAEAIRALIPTESDTKEAGNE